MLTARAIPVLAAASLFFAAPARASVDPPVARISTDAGSTEARARSYCWPSSGEPRLCVDSPFVSNPERYLAVAPGETVRFSMPRAEATPRRVRLQVWNLLPARADIRKTPHGPSVADVMLDPGHAPEWVANLPRGKYVASVGAFWTDRDAAWTFGIQIGADARGAPAGAARRGAVTWPVGLAMALLLVAALVALVRARAADTTPTDRA